MVRLGAANPAARSMPRKSGSGRRPPNSAPPSRSTYPMRRSYFSRERGAGREEAEAEAPRHIGPESLRARDHRDHRDKADHDHVPGAVGGERLAEEENHERPFDRSLLAKPAVRLPLR